jgi:hypothetical protein
MKLFDYVSSINFTKKDIMIDDVTEAVYNPFVINRSLSYFEDTVMLANEMNINHHIDSRLQYDFLINTIRKCKRFSKWAKPDNIETITAIMEYYKYSEEKAKAVLSLLGDDEIIRIKETVSKGGIRK